MSKIETGANCSQWCRQGELGRWIAGTSLLTLAIAFAAPATAQVSEPALMVSQPAGTAATGSAPAAQAAAVTDSAAAADSSQVGEILVTARRVSERLQDIPASVAAVTGAQVERMSSLADLQSMVSGVTFKAYGPIPTVGIRGFGNRTQAGNAVNSTVGIFEDGVFVAPPLVTIINRVDTQRVEVAKGPQSTLYGRSSFTGAINIVSNDPGKTFSGYLDAGYGGSSVHGENLWHVRGAVSIPLSDTLSVRVFGLREKRDGFTYDSATGNRGGGYDRKVGRVRLLWEPSSDFTARLTGTILRDNLPLNLTHTGRNSPPLGQNNLFGNPLSPAVRSALQFGNSVWDAIYVNPQSAKTRGEQGTLDMRIQTPIGELASLSDYQHSRQDIQTSLDLTRLAYARGDTLFDEERYSQEFRLSNKVGRFTYLAGLYYLHIEAAQGGGKTPDLSHTFANFGPGSSFFDGLVIPRVPINALVQPIYTKTNAYAAFGQVGYDITDDLNLTVGLRQSRDKLSGPTSTSFRTAAGRLIVTAPVINRRGTFNATTGTANLSYKVAHDVTVYGSYSRGNSPGGLNVGGAAAQLRAAERRCVRTRVEIAAARSQASAERRTVR